MTFVYLVTHTHQGERINCQMYESKASAEHHVKASHQAFLDWQLGKPHAERIDWTQCMEPEMYSHIQEWNVQP